MKRNIIIAIISVIIIIILGFMLLGGKSTAEKITEQLELGNKYLSEGNYKEAVISFNKAIEIEPKNVEARLGLADVYKTSGEYDKAEIVLKEAIAIDNTRTDIYLELIEVYEEADKDVMDIVDLINKGYEKTNDEIFKEMLYQIISGLIDSGNKYLNEGKYEEATNEFDTVLKIDNKNVKALYGLADINITIKDYDKAENILQDIIEIDNSNSDAYFKLFEIYRIVDRDIEEIKSLLKEAYNNTNDNRFKEMLDEYENLGKSVEDFVPAGWKVIDYVKGDLNKDDLGDIVVVIEKKDDRNSRSLFILFKNISGYYKLAIKTDKAILGANDGGVWGDPFESINYNRGSVLINHYGGSAWRWSSKYRFRFQDNGWYLIGATLEDNNANTGEGTFEDFNLLTGNTDRISTDSNGNKIKENFNIGKKPLLNLLEFNIGSGIKDVLKIKLPDVKVKESETVSSNTKSGEDTYIDASNSNTNFNEKGSLLIGNHETSAYVLKTLIKFDISNLPSKVSSAKIRLHYLGHYKYGDDNEYPDNNYATKISVHNVPEPWDASNETWESRGQYDLMPIDTTNTKFPQSTDGTYVDLDITELYNAWKTGAVENNGVVISGAETWQDVWYICGFVSSNNTDYPNYHPKLIVR